MIIGHSRDHGAEKRDSTMLFVEEFMGVTAVVVVGEHCDAKLSRQPVVGASRLKLRWKLYRISNKDVEFALGVMCKGGPEDWLGDTWNLMCDNHSTRLALRYRVGEARFALVQTMPVTLTLILVRERV